MPEHEPELPPLREVIAAAGLAAKKSLGQHFLLDLNLTRRIARAAPDLSQGTVIEVGPGPGGLTRALLAEGARHLVVVEKDERCLAALAEIAAAWSGRLEVVAGDALALNLEDLGSPPRQIVSNLPYNISTVLLVRWLTALAADPQAFSAMTLMFQKEVAERLTARPRCSAYGRLSVLTQWLCAPRILFDIPPRAFTPPPKVVSTVVALMPRPQPLAAASLAALERVTSAAFGQRRKMLRQSLKSLGLDAAQLFDATGIAPTARAEELSVEEFCALARQLARRAAPSRRSAGP